MKYDREKSFGYPVLRSMYEDENENLLDYFKAGFDPDFQVLKPTEEGKEHLAKIEFDADHGVQELKELMKKEKVSLCIQLYCPSTFIRLNKEIFALTGEFYVEANDFRNEIQLSGFLVATQDIEFTSKKFHSDFGLEPVKVEKGSVLAWAEPIKRTVDKEQFKKISSIFNLYQKIGLENGEFEIELSGDYISIWVNSETFHKLKTAESDLHNRLSILSGFYTLVLTDVLIELKETDDKEDAFATRWATIVRQKCISAGIDLDDQKSMTNKAQKLLDFPVYKTLAKRGI